MVLIKNVLTPLTKSDLVPLELTAGASATDAVIPKKTFESGTTTLIIYNKEKEDIMKINKFLEELGLLKKGVSQTIKNEAKKQKGEFLRMLLGTLATSILGHMLARKPNMCGQGVIRAGEAVIQIDEGTTSAR